MPTRDRDGAIGNLSATMVACLDLALMNGGELVRYQGGYWASRSDGHPTVNQREYHGTKTVEALVSRGIAHYSEYRDGRNGRFPTAVRLSPVAQPLGSGNSNEE